MTHGRSPRFPDENRVHQMTLPKEQVPAIVLRPENQLRASLNLSVFGYALGLAFDTHKMVFGISKMRHGVGLHLGPLNIIVENRKAAKDEFVDKILAAMKGKKDE